MHPAGRKARRSDFQHQVVLYLCILHHLRIAGHRIPCPGVRDEHAETPAQAQSHLGLLNLKGFAPPDVIIKYDQSRVDVLPGIGRSSSANFLSFSSHPVQSGGGLVKATVNGKRQLVELDVDNSLLKSDDKVVLQDLIIAAVNKAAEEADVKAKEELRKSTEGLLPNIPGMDLSSMMG